MIRMEKLVSQMRKRRFQIILIAFLDSRILM